MKHAAQNAGCYQKRNQTENTEKVDDKLISYLITYLFFYDLSKPYVCLVPARDFGLFKILLTACCRLLYYPWAAT